MADFCRSVVKTILFHPIESCRRPSANNKSAVDLKSFLVASRAAYNSFVHYHNFRHVVDVMQAVFHFLLRLGTLPPYPSLDPPSSVPLSSPRSLVGTLLKPFDALTLLISAIGHDVGHPGVNNAFLVALKAPLAQLYNDKSVLESFHCAAYSQILRRYWKSVFEDTAMRGLMISSILATDMGLHFKYMEDLSNLQEKIRQDKSTEGWSQQTVDEYRTLTCGLLIKCADISNVVSNDDHVKPRLADRSAGAAVQYRSEMGRYTPARIRQPGYNGNGPWDVDHAFWWATRIGQPYKACELPARVHEHLCLSSLWSSHRCLTFNVLRSRRNEGESKHMADKD